MFVRRILSMGVALALLLAPSLARSAVDPVNLDVVLPLTGPGAFGGQTFQKALVILQNTVNKQGGIQGRPVNFAFHDDQTNPSTTLQVTTDILSHKPSVVFGSSLGSLCSSTMQLFANGPVSYCFSPVISPPKGGYIFSASVAGIDLIRINLRYLNARGLKRFATLATTDTSGQIGDRDIAALLKTPEFKDMQLVAAEHMGATDTSATAQISKIKAANPQALILWTPGTPLGTALHSLSDVGLDVPVMTTSANMIHAQMKSYAGIIPSKGIYFQGVAYVQGVTGRKMTPAMTTFITAMKDGGLPRDLISGLAWDPAMIVIDALRKIGPNASADQLHTYLEGLHDYVGITATYDLRDGNQRGITVDDALIERWDESKGDFEPSSKFGGQPL